MTLLRAALVSCLLLPSGPVAAAAMEAAPPERGKEFWRAIVKADFAVPDGASPYELIVELTSYLGSPDPELRDDFAYSIPAAWIFRDRKLSAGELDSLRRRLQSNLMAGIGSSGDETVLLRSFSALDLSVVAALDNEAPFLDEKGFGELLDAALDYLARERDLRGWVAGSGWHHSVAHTADLLKFLARSRHLKAADARRLLTAIGEKLGATEAVLVWGEDERLARAVLALARRPELPPQLFASWVEARRAEWERAWKSSPLDPARHAAARNGKNVLASLYWMLAAAEPTAARDAARDQVMGALRRM